MNDREQHKLGNHWVLVVMLPHEVIFFDSFAKSPRHNAIDKHLHKIKRKIIIDRMVLQGPLSNVCGEFCMFFGFFLCRGYRLEVILKHFSEDFSSTEKAVYLQIQKLQNTVILLVGYTHLACYLTTENMHYNKKSKRMYLLCLFPTA